MAKQQTSLKQQELSNQIGFSDSDWQTITEDDLTDYSLGDVPYPLPEEAQDKQDAKEFAFRWIERNPARLKEIMGADVPEKWWPCNSTNTPYLSKHCDLSDGAVHCKDQMLVFKPWWMHRKRQDAIDGTSEAQLKGDAIEAKHRTQEEDGSEWYAGEQSRIQKNDVVMGKVSDDI